MAYTHTRRQAHEIIDRIAPSQVSAVVGLLETMIDPVSRAIANAPWDDEPETEDERKGCDRVQGVDGRTSRQRRSL